MAARKDASRSTPPNRRRLGRGLTSLMSTPVPIESAKTEPPPTRSPDPPATDGPDVGDLRHVDINQIRADPRQPRERFDEAALDALAASIRTAGLMQPIVLRPLSGGGFQIVVGERRWRAAQKVGLARVPAVIREIDDQTAAEWALIENIQREDLNPMERAEAFRRLTEEFEMTHQEVAERVGLNRSTITNFIRLLDLDDLTRDAVGRGRLGQAHARLLLGVTNLQVRRHLAELAIREDWSVRVLEKRIGTLTTAPTRPVKSAAAPAHRLDIERQLSDHLGTRVRFHPGKKKGTGRLSIEFYTLDQFDGLMERLGFKGSEL